MCKTKGISRFTALLGLPAVVCTAILALSSIDVSAQSPAGCNADLTFVNLARAPGQAQNVTNGSTVFLSMGIGNQTVDPLDAARIGCDASNIFVRFVCPQTGTGAQVGG